MPEIQWAGAMRTKSLATENLQCRVEVVVTLQFFPAGSTLSAGFLPMARTSQSLNTACSGNMRRRASAQILTEPGKGGAALHPHDNQIGAALQTELAQQVGDMELHGAL
jgi:hypothetical protein